MRLAEIDAPEGGQPYGHRAKQELSALAFNKEARGRVQDTDCAWTEAVGNAIHPDSQPTKDLSRLTKATCNVIGVE